jgi:hypothetical protein
VVIVYVGPAKYPATSNVNMAGPLVNALIEPFPPGTRARLDVTAPSKAFSVDASGIP